MLDCYSAHEPETHTLLHLQQDRITTQQQRRVLEARDAWLWLELESNWMLGLVIEGLFSAFPNAQYILTVRDPIGWVESEINQEYVIGKTEPYATAFEEMFGGLLHSRYDQTLANHGFYSLDGYLSYWASYHRRVLNLIPKTQLLVVATSEISQRAGAICDFVNARGVFPSKSHSYARKEKRFKLTNLVDEAYLHEKVSQHTASARDLLSDYMDA